MKIKLISTLLIFAVLLSGHLAAAEQEDSKKDQRERFELGFKQKVRFFIEFGAQGGGDSTAPLPIYARPLNAFVSGVDLTVVGQWDGLPPNLDPTFEDTVEAGGFYKFAAGAEFPLFDQVTLIASYGVQFDEVYGDLTDGTGGQGSFQYTRQTIELIPFYNMGRHRIGIGAEMHYQPRGIHKEDAVGQFRLKSTYYFDDAVGTTIRYDYLLDEDWSLGVKLTEMTYDFERVRTRYTVGTADIVNDSFPCVAGCEEAVTADSFGIHLTYRF